MRTRTRIMKVTRGCRIKMNMAILKISQIKDKTDRNKGIIFFSRNYRFD